MAVPDSELPDLVRQYQQAYDALTGAEADEAAAALLQLLLTRDRVQATLAACDDAPADVMQRVIALDGRLEEVAPTLPAAAFLPAWRHSLSPPATSWWWQLEQRRQRPFWDRFDWLWSALSVLFIIIALSLAIDISQRFLVGGPDTVGAFAVLGQAALGALAAGSLTKAGQQFLERIAHIPAFFRAEARLILSILLFVAILLFRLSLPRIAVHYNNTGRDHHRAGELLSAQYDYQRAIRLFPDYSAAHYNLGLLREDLLDDEAALQSYQIALAGGLDAAYNNAARLYILQQEPEQAVSLLINGLALTADPQVQHDMYKNLGWARVQQGAFHDAQAALEQALSLEEKNAADYCLLAQALDGLGEQTAAAAWQRCVALANSSIPEEDAWRIQGQQWLQTQGE